MNNQTRQILELYIEKATLLAQGEFVRYTRENGLGVSLAVDYQEEHFKTALIGSSTEALLALATTLRFFLQNNEPISFQNLPRLYADLSPQWGEQCTCIITGMKKILSVRPYNLTAGGEPVTLEKVQEVFIYGALAHSSKREQYKQWEDNRAMYPLMRFFFDSAVATVIETIFAIAFLTELELRGKEIPPRRSLFHCARLTRAKEASEWRVLTTYSQMAQCTRGLTEQLATTTPTLYDEATKPSLTFTR